MRHSSGVRLRCPGCYQRDSGFTVRVECTMPLAEDGTLNGDTPEEIDEPDDSDEVTCSACNCCNDLSAFVQEDNPNTNILHDIRCPKCGHTDDFNMEVPARWNVTDNQFHLIDEPESLPDGQIECGSCGHEDDVSAFEDN